MGCLGAGVSMYFGGIDPGNNGAFVVIDAACKVWYQKVMPLIDIRKGKANKWIVDQGGVLRVLREIKSAWPDVRFILEKAQVIAGPGGRSPAAPRSMFQYGRGFGAIEMGLLALELSFTEAAPTEWGKILRGVEGSDTKARSILKAQRALPTLDLCPGQKRKPHDGLADAGCMALYGCSLTGVALPSRISPALNRSDRILPPGPPGGPRNPPPPPKR